MLSTKKRIKWGRRRVFFRCVWSSGGLINDDDSFCRVFAQNNLTNLENQPQQKKNQAGFIFCAAFFSIETFRGKKFVKRWKIFWKGFSIHNPPGLSKDGSGVLRSTDKSKVRSTHSLRTSYPFFGHGFFLLCSWKNFFSMFSTQKGRQQRRKDENKKER